MVFLPVAGYAWAAAPWGSTGGSVAPRHLQQGSAGGFESLGGSADVDSPEPLLETRLLSLPGCAALVLARGLVLQGGCRGAPLTPGQAGGGKLPALKDKEKLCKESLGDEIIQNEHGAVTDFTSANGRILWGC